MNMQPITEMLLNMLKRFLPYRMQLFLIRMTAKGLHVLYDRAYGKKIIVFHLSLAGQAAYIQPIINELNLRGEKISIYLVVDKELNLSPLELSKLTGVKQSKIIRWNWLNALGTIDVFITPTQWIARKPNAKIRICIFHGQPTKGNTFQPELIRHFNTLFLLGSLQRSLYDDFSRRHPEIAADINAFPVGYPKSDDLLRGRFNRDAILHQLSLDPGQPVVLYAPAFDKGTSLDMYGDQVIEKLLELDISVIVKLHPMCYDPRYYPGGINWTERLKRFENNPRFRHAGNVPLDPFLAASNILVTDVSGSALEFMTLNKPVVFIDCSDFFTNTLGQEGYERSGQDVLQDIRANAGRSAGIVVSNPSELPDAVGRCLQYPEEFEPQRLAIRRQLFYNPGNAASIATDTLIKIVFEQIKQPPLYQKSF